MGNSGWASHTYLNTDERCWHSKTTRDTTKLIQPDGPFLPFKYFTYYSTFCVSLLSLLIALLFPVTPSGLFCCFETFLDFLFYFLTCYPFYLLSYYCGFAKSCRKCCFVLEKFDHNNSIVLESVCRDVELVTIIQLLYENQLNIRRKIEK